jgi:hypothetical protein
MSWISENPQGFVLTIFVQPRSSKNMIAGLHGQALKIRLTAPPVDNAANRMCVQFLSKCLNVPKSAIEILSGQTGRTKQVLVRVTGDREAVREKIETLPD